MADNKQASAAARLTADRHPVLRQCGDVRAWSAWLARRLAAVEEDVAATMACLAEQRPERAEHFQALSDRAGASAACARQWAEHGAQPEGEGEDDGGLAEGVSRTPPATARCSRSAMQGRSLSEGSRGIDRPAARRHDTRPVRRPHGYRFGAVGLAGDDDEPAPRLAEPEEHAIAADSSGGSGSSFTRWGFEVTSSDGLPVVRVPAEIDLQSSAALGQALDAASAAGPTVIVDMTGNVFCDSSGLGMLVIALKRATAADGELRLVMSSSHVRHVFKSTGIDRMVPIFATLAEAVAAGRPDASQTRAGTS